MSEALSNRDLVELIRSVFLPGAEDRSLALLTDLPDERLADHPDWAARRAMVADWYQRLSAVGGDAGLTDVRMVFYRNVRRNNADLPERAQVYEYGPLPERPDERGPASTEFAQIFRDHRLLIAATELSATAPLKLLAPRHGFRAATMPGFAPSMVPALRLDYEEIHHRCVGLAGLLDAAVAARIRFQAAGEPAELLLDLRHRRATASGGLIRDPGTAGNLPSGETYIVPYEGEREGDPSGSRGVLPLELDGELLRYRIEGNRVREVLGTGPRAAVERAEIAAEPAYANVAELGLGILAGYGIRPVGALLLDEKLGLHIAFGRSDHFGGSVGAADFSSPDKVVHIDRVYLPEVQPQVRVVSVDLERGEDRVWLPLMRDGAYVDLPSGED